MRNIFNASTGIKRERISHLLLLKCVGSLLVQSLHYNLPRTGHSSKFTSIRLTNDRLAPKKKRKKDCACLQPCGIWSPAHSTELNQHQNQYFSNQQLIVCTFILNKLIACLFFHQLKPVTKCVCMFTGKFFPKPFCSFTQICRHPDGDKLGHILQVCHTAR